MAMRSYYGKKRKVDLNLGLIALCLMLLTALTAGILVQFGGYTIARLGNIPTIIMAILGAVVGGVNITREEQINFMISVATMTIVILAISTVVALPQLLTLFLLYLTVGFGVAGFIVSLGTIIKLGWKK